MAKQNEISLSALNRARLRRQRSAAESSDATPEEPGEDVMVPSFLWEPTQEAPSGAASWKEDPLPVRRRRPASREVLDAAPDAPPLLRDREASGRDAEAAMPHEGRAYVFSPRSGREMVEQPDADVSSASPDVFPPFAAEDDLRRYDDGELRDDAPYLQENGPAGGDGDPVRTQAPAGDSVAVPADDRAGEESMLPDEDAAAASGEEDRRELEEALAARGIAMPQPQPEESRKGPARTLSEDMELPAAWSPRDEDEDGPSEAALASGEEDLRELRAALAAQGIPLRRERQPEAAVRETAAAMRADEPEAENFARPAGAASKVPCAPADEAPEAVPSPADFAVTPDAFLTAFASNEEPAPRPAEDTADGEGGSVPPRPEEGQGEPPAPPRLPEPPEAGRNWLRRFFLTLGLLTVVAVGLLLPYSFWWVHASGDVAVERAVASQAGGNFAIFGSGVSQDFVDYKLQLYAAVKPEIAVVGSSRVMQFRGSYFRRPFVNVGGTAGNLSVLRSTIDAMLRIHRPQAVIIGLDFWWFSAGWQKNPFAPEPPTSGSYVYDLETLKAPWKWLLEGKIGWREFFAPLTGAFRDDRFGIMAQRSSDGFASDGSWHYTADVTGQQRPFDYQFGDTLKQVRYGIKAFAPAPVLSEEHLDAFAEIYCRLKSRGIQTYVFIAPLSATVLDAMRERQAGYPHLFSLYTALMERGIDVMDFTDPRKFGSSDCEFVDGFHGGEVTYTRILRDLVDRYHALVAYVDVERINRVLKEWKGHATVYDERVTTLPEVDFMNLSCPKKQR